MNIKNYYIFQILKFYNKNKKGLKQLISLQQNFLIITKNTLHFEKKSLEQIFKEYELSEFE